MGEGIDFDFANNNKSFIERHNIEYVVLRYGDIEGKSHDLQVHVSDSIFNEDKTLKDMTLDGSSISGFSNISNSSLIMSPDDRAYIDNTGEHKALVVFSDIKTVDGELFDRAPRTILKNAVEHLKEEGLQANFGLEPEYFMDKKVDGVREFADLPADKHHNNTHYHESITGRDLDVTREVVDAMNDADIKSRFFHTEVATHQFEAEVSVDDSMTTADNVSIQKAIVQAIADKNDYLSTFSPKPIPGVNGSGMHTNMSFSDLEGNNLFIGEHAINGDKNAALSDTALHAIGGIIKHIEALQAFANPTEESYDRLVPNFEAPVSVGYAANNRSIAIRVPGATDENARRIELRFPDPSADTHLLLAAVQMAALDGIKNEINPGEPVKGDVFEMTPKERQDAGIGELNTNSYNRSTLIERDGLEKSLQSLKDDHDFLLEGNVFTKDFIDTYIDVTKDRAAHDNEKREAKEELNNTEKKSFVEMVMKPVSQEESKSFFGKA